MKILVITHLFTPDRGGGASVFTDFCCGLAEREHDVHVYAGYPYYPEWRNKSGADLWKVEKTNSYGVTLYRHGFFIPSKPSSLFQRVIYELSFTLSLLRSLRRVERCDMVIVYCPLLGSVIFSVLRKWWWKEPLWINIQDIPAEAAKAAGIGAGGFFSAASAIQKFLFSRGDLVSSISPIMLERIRAIVSPHKPVYFPNWLNASMASTIVRLSTMRLQQKPSGPVKILYAGNIGKKQGLLELCGILAATAWEYSLKIFGDGSEGENLRTWGQETKDPRFKIGTFLSEEDFVSELYQADFFMITETARVGGAFIPSKLIPCIGCGIPILAICDRNGPLATEVAESDLGCVIEWDQTERIEPLLSSSTVASSEYRRWTAACLDRARVYSRASALDTAEKLIGEVLSKKGRSAFYSADGSISI